MRQFHFFFHFSQTRSERGQGLIEYALIILLVILGVILVLGLLGGQVQSSFQVIVDALAGAGGS
ncbi:Flp family type IVb pilin [bacterium]|nr:Flp family type IVb pilin [bacterium]